jgi:hypothetical protein
MNWFIFKMPKDTPELDFVTLKARMEAEYGGEELRYGDKLEIGTTVIIRWNDSGGLPSVEFVLYGLHIARISANEVRFTYTDDPHLATAEWTAKIVRDNAIGGSVWRMPRRKADGEGPWTSRGRAGLLCINGNRDKPVWGNTYRVSQDAIADRRRKHAEWEAEAAVRREEYAAESRRREALKTWTSPVLGAFYASDDYSQATGSFWRAVDMTFRDGGASYDTVGYVHDTRPGSGASPDSDGSRVFEAFAGADQLTTRSLGTFPTVADALAAIAGKLVLVPADEDDSDLAALPDTLRDLRED